MTEESLEQQLVALRENLVGKPVDEAKVLCKEYGWHMRCRVRDGESMVGTCDFRTDRINYIEVAGVVTEVTGIG